MHVEILALAQIQQSQLLMNQETTKSKPIAEIQRLRDLLESIDHLSNSPSDGPHLSLYAPAAGNVDHPSPTRIHFSNAIAEASESLQSAGIGANEASAFLRPASELLEDKKFWSLHHGGVACFISESDCTILELDVELPNRGVLSSSYWIRPLLQAAANADAFYLLAISQGSVKLLRGSDLGIRIVECPGLPNSYRSAIESLGYSPDSTTLTAAESHLKANDEHLKKFFRVIDAAITSHIGSGGLPLVLACVDSYAPLYRDVNSYLDLNDSIIPGNAEHTQLETLRQQCQELLRPSAEDSLKRQLERVHDPSCVQANGLKAVLSAAHQARISVLLLPSDTDKWGTFDPREDCINEDPSASMSNTDLYELAARKALDTGAEVFFANAQDLPEDGDPVAILRWGETSKQ